MIRFSSLGLLLGQHMTPKMEQFARSKIRRRQSAQRRQHDFNRRQFVVAHGAAGVALGQTADAARLLGEILKKIPVLFQIENLESESRQMLAIEISAESR